MLKRGVPKNRTKHKKALWTQNQKLQVVSTYLMLGSMTETALVTGVPYKTIESWKTSDWFKEYALKLQSEDIQQMDSNLRRVVDKALKAVEDRIDRGDAQYNQKTGEIARIPIKAHVALKITTELMTKREKILIAPVKEEMVKTIDDRLLRLAEEFASFSKPRVIVDVSDAKIVSGK
jgi:hypothetical protein